MEKVFQLLAIANLLFASRCNANLPNHVLDIDKGADTIPNLAYPQQEGRSRTLPLPPPVATYPPPLPTKPTNISGVPPTPRPLIRPTTPSRPTTQPTQKTTPKPSTTPTQKTTPKPSKTPKPDSNPNNDACGIKGKGRIIGGAPRQLYEWPWMAALMMNGKLVCGGTLLDDKRVLTAAKCVYKWTSDDLNHLRIRLGDYNIKTPNETNHIEKEASRIIYHEYFVRPAVEHDIAIIFLKDPVKYTDYIRRICAPIVNGSYVNVENRTAIAAGWGTLGGQTTNILRDVNITIWPNDECQKKYTTSPYNLITQNSLCAGNLGQDTCNGDIGGPLMVETEGSLWRQVGIVSWGNNCNLGELPGVYTRVADYFDWIQQNRN